MTDMEPDTKAVGRKLKDMINLARIGFDEAVELEQSASGTAREKFITKTEGAGRQLAFDAYRQALIASWELLTGRTWVSQRSPRVLYEELVLPNGS